MAAKAAADSSSQVISLGQQLVSIGYGSSLQYISRGSYASVFKIISSTGKPVALKIMLCDTSKPLPSYVCREARAMTSLCHPNIMPLERIIIGENLVCLEMPLYHCSLSGLLQTFGYMSESHVAYIVKKVALAMANAASHGIMHRDIKPCNILLRGDDVAVSDWGLSRDVRDTTPGQMSSEVITLWFAPPEVICEQRTYGQTADVWSLGMVMINMLSGRNVHTSHDRPEFLHSIFHLMGNETLSVAERQWFDTVMPSLYPRTCDMPTSPGIFNSILRVCSVSDSLRHLLTGMLRYIPSERMTWDQVCVHPFLLEASKSLIELDTLACVEHASSPAKERPTKAPASLKVLNCPKSDVVLFRHGWNMGDTVTYDDLQVLTTFVVRMFGSTLFRSYLMAMHMSWQLKRVSPTTLLGCVSLAFGAMGTLMKGRDFSTHSPPFGCDSTAALAAAEMSVLSDLGGVFPLPPVEWEMYKPLRRNGRGQVLAMFLWCLPDMDRSTIVPLCLDYDCRVPNDTVTKIQSDLKLIFQQTRGVVSGNIKA